MDERDSEDISEKEDDEEKDNQDDDSCEYEEDDLEDEEKAEEINEENDETEKKRNQSNENSGDEDDNKKDEEEENEEHCFDEIFDNQEINNFLRELSESADEEGEGNKDRDGKEEVEDEKETQKEKIPDNDKNKSNFDDDRDSRQKIDIINNHNNDTNNQKESQKALIDEIETHINVLLAEENPKLAEKDLKKLPDPPNYHPMDKKAKKLYALTEKIDNAEKKQFRKISGVLDYNNKEIKKLDKITRKKIENATYVVPNEKNGPQRYYYEYENHFIHNAILVEKAIESRTNNEINKIIDNNRKIIEKLEEKMTKIIDKTFPNPPGENDVKKLDSVIEKIEDTDKMQLQQISKILDSKNKEIEKIDKITREKIKNAATLLHNRKIDEIHYYNDSKHHYIKNAINTENTIESRANKRINKTIDRNRKEMDKLEGKMERIVKKSLPNPPNYIPGKNPVKILNIPNLQSNNENVENAENTGNTGNAENVRNIAIEEIGIYNGKRNRKKKKKYNEFISNDPKIEINENSPKKNKIKNKEDFYEKITYFYPKNEIKSDSYYNTNFNLDGLIDKIVDEEKSKVEPKSGPDEEQKTISQTKKCDLETSHNENANKEEYNQTEEHLTNENITINTNSIVKKYQNKQLDQNILENKDDQNKLNIFSKELLGIPKQVQNKLISSAIGKKKNQKNPRYNNMPIFIKNSSRNMIKTAFNLPNGIKWHQTIDYQIKKKLISKYKKIQNPLENNLIISEDGYKRKISVSSKTGMLGISKPSKIPQNFPISILKNSKITSSDIYKLFPLETQSQESIKQNTIPYMFLMDFRVQIMILSGKLNLAMEPNFQFHFDKNLHNIIKTKWFQRIATLLRITIESINRMKITLSFGGYGKQQYTIWNAMDWLLEIIDEKGNLNEKHLYKKENDGGVTVYEYYKVLHNIVSALYEEYSPAHADLILKSLLPKKIDESLSHLKIKKKYTLQQILEDIQLNWDKTLNADSFKLKYGQNSDLWKIFTTRSDLDTAFYLVSLLQIIAYISKNSTSDTNPKLKKSFKMFGFNSVLYPALNKLMELYSEGENFKILDRKTPLNEIIQNNDSQTPFALVSLADNLQNILCTPWKMIKNPLYGKKRSLLFNRLRWYIQNSGNSVYEPSAMNSIIENWTTSASIPLFIKKLKHKKAYFGKFGEKKLVKIRNSGKFYWLNHYISEFEHDFITARCTIVKDDINADFELKQGYKFLATGETLEHGNLPKKLEVSRLSKKKLKKSFLDNITGFINNFVIAGELYGYKKISYRNNKNFGALSWIINGYFPLYTPYTDITRPSKAKRIKEMVMKIDAKNPEKTRYIGKISPFTDNLIQTNKILDLYAHILSKIDKKLRFDDFLLQMRIPKNIKKWQIQKFLNRNIKETISWINRIHWIFGIRVNPKKNFKFDYIINTPPENPYNFKPDPNYQEITDPFNSKYDPKMIATYDHYFKYSPALKIDNTAYKQQRTLSYYYKWFYNLKKFIDNLNNLKILVEKPQNKPDLYAQLAYFLIFEKYSGLNP